MKHTLRRRQYPGDCGPEPPVRPESGLALAAVTSIFLLPVQETSFYLVIVIIGLLLLGLVFAVLLWQFMRRRKRASAPPTLERLAETDLHQLETLTVAPANGETVPSPAAAVKDKTKTQPSPVYRAGSSKTEPSHRIGEVAILPASGHRPAGIKWRIAGLTDTGLKRELNEDNLLLAEAEMAEGSPYGLYLVADGMGGHQGGDIASQLIVDTVRQRFERSPLSYETPFNDWLTGAVMAANENVLAHQQDRTQEKKMGSTLVVALVTEGQAHIANVGDSRAYHITTEGIEQMSVDHSLVERLVQLGQLTREEARTHSKRNVIYNTIGDKPNPEIGLYHLLLHPGDRLLLCSDGLSGMLPDADILAISRRQPDTAAACKALVEAALTAGGEDNITVVLIQVL